MNRHGYGNDDKAFEEFRREKTMRRRQRQRAAGEGALVYAVSNETIRIIEEGEQREATELRLRREMFEFVRDTTKLAAGVLTEVSDEQSAVLSRQVSGEMREFFKSTQSGTENLLGELLDERDPQQVPQVPQQELEAHMAALDAETLDRYRAAGSAEAARRHAGEELHPDGAKPAVSEEMVDAAITDAAIVADSAEDLRFGFEDALARGAASRDLADPLEVAPDGLDADLQDMAAVPLAFAEILAEPAVAKRALAALVKIGVLDKQTARQIFADSRPLSSSARA